MLESKSQSLIHATEMHLNIAKLCIQVDCDLLVTFKALLRCINTARCANFLHSTPTADLSSESEHSKLFTAMQLEGNRLACEAFHLLGVLLEKEQAGCLVETGTVGIGKDSVNNINIDVSEKKRKKKPASSGESTIGNCFGMLLAAAAAYSSALEMRHNEGVDSDNGDRLSISNRKTDEEALLRVQKQISKIQRSRTVGS